MCSLSSHKHGPSLAPLCWGVWLWRIKTLRCSWTPRSLSLSLPPLCLSLLSPPLSFSLSLCLSSSSVSPSHIFSQEIEDARWFSYEDVMLALEQPKTATFRLPPKHAISHML